MKSFAVVFLLGFLFALVSAQTSFDPPSALAPSPDSPLSPASPDSPVSADPIEIYSLSPLSAFSPSPFSNIIVLPPAFSYGRNFSPFTKVSGTVHNNLSPLSSQSPISIPSFSPFAPLFGSHSSDAGALQVSMTLLVVCIAAFIF